MMLGAISANITLPSCLNLFCNLNIYQRGSIAKLDVVPR